MSSLINQNINLIVSDPWEFGDGPFSAVIKRISPCKTMIHVDLDNLVEFKGLKCRHFIAKLRQGDEFDENQSITNKDLDLVMVDIDDDDTDWLKLDAWRGGVAIIATVK